MTTRHLHHRLLTLATVVALALAAAAASAAAPAGASPQAGDREVRVLSYNIQHGRDLDRVVDLERTAAVIRATEAPIVTLQEVDRHFGERSGFVDQARELGRLLGMHVTYGANIDWAPLDGHEQRRQYGTAILSRYPILASDNLLLPIHGAPRPEPEAEPSDEPWSEPRGLLWARINVRGVPVNVYTTHLQSNSTAPSPESGQQQRAEQITTIIDQIEARGGLTILTGDLNALPDSEEMAPLHDVLRDTWEEAGEGPGYTAYLPTPDRRIDYVFVSPDIAIDDVEVVPADGSDHLPVHADVRLPGSAVGVGRAGD